jgi:hypothetical protein
MASLLLALLRSISRPRISWFTPATEEEHLLAVVNYPSVALQDDDRSENIVRSRSISTREPDYYI